MKKQTILAAILFTFLSTLSGCEIIGGIFKTGMGFGVIGVIVLVVIIIFLFNKLKGTR